MVKKQQLKKSTIQSLSSIRLLTILSTLCIFSAKCMDTDESEDSIVPKCAEAETMETCDAMEGCSPILGRKVNLKENCVSPEKKFWGCRVSDDCEEEVGFALDPETGECYTFPNLCLPEGLNAVQISHPSCSLPSMQLCSE